MLRNLAAALRATPPKTNHLPKTPLQSAARQSWNRSIAYNTRPNGVFAKLEGSGLTSSGALRPRWRRENFPAGMKPSRPSHSATQRRAFHFTRARKSQTSTAEPTSLSARLKKLSREYGWTAVGVYFALSVLDFPFCFALVRVVGTDRIAEIEHKVVSTVAKIIPTSVKEWWANYRQALKKSEKENLGSNDVSEDVEMVGWNVKEAEAHHQTEASLATQLALAYAIHKSFIFVRVPLTAAILPKVVKVLRSWGWQIGKRRPKP